MNHADFREKFKQIVKAQDIIFPQLEEECGKIFFTLKSSHFRQMYMRIGSEFHLMLGEETEEARTFIKSLYDAGIITNNGEILYNYPESWLEKHIY